MTAARVATDAHQLTREMQSAYERHPSRNRCLGWRSVNVEVGAMLAS